LINLKQFKFLTFFDPKMGDILRESFNVIPAKAGIQLSAFTYWMALKRFTSCPASAGMTDRFLLNRSV
jgi:hypothetical protein